MTLSEQDARNRAIGKLNKLEWLIRVQRKVEYRVDILGEQEAVKLLKQIEELL